MKKYLLFLLGILCPGLCLLAQTDSTKTSDTLTPFNSNLDTVIFSTGFQTLPRERATGSFTQIDNELFNRRVGTDVLSRLDGVASGVIFNKNTNQIVNQSTLTIRGRSTLFANPNPLIVIDNFPYDGDINNINPNDVESVTILKDAAAASIWGARSANGVIVITTKKGKRDQALKVTLNSNATVSPVPDLYYYPRLDAKSYIELEKFFFDNQQYFSTAIGGYSPVVDLLFMEQSGEISSGDLEAGLEYFSIQDNRSDYEKYVYRRSLQQQHSIALSGGGKHNQYFFSAGFDRNLSSFSKEKYSRITINSQNTFSFLDNKASLSTGLIYTHSLSNMINNIGSPRIYERLVDENGTALPAAFNYRFTYTDTVAQGQLQDWTYTPLDEINLADNKSEIDDYRINLVLNYAVTKELKAEMLYQHSSGMNSINSYYSPETYFVRDLYNQFAQLNYVTSVPEVNPVIPLNGIFDQNQRSYSSHQGRIQLSYGNTFAGRHQLNALAGVEIKDLQSQIRSNRIYGYDKDLQTSVLMNFATQYPVNPFGSSQVPGNLSNQLIIQRFINSYFNGAYTFDDKYTLSLSLRKDASNLFGVNVNQRAVPLGSAGISWNLHKERFYRARWLPFVKLRATVGYNGNLDNNASGLSTMTYSFINNPYGSPYGVPANPPNSELRWEKVLMVNLGMDFGLPGDVIAGSIDYYNKKASDVLGFAPAAPQTGFNRLYRNSANLSTTGIDVVLHSLNIDRRFRWSTDLLLSYSLDKVTRYEAEPPSAVSYLELGFINPIEGRPLYSLYSFPWAGLNETGQPQGLFDGKKTVNYTDFFNAEDANNLVYHGPVIPVYFGNIRNTFSYKAISVSANVSFKFGYYFRGLSMDYASFVFSNYAHPNFKERWTQPGDELTTSVPSLIYPIDYSREAFYSLSSELVEKADHIRLQDIQLSYTLPEKSFRNFVFPQVKLYLFSGNPCILWRANKSGIDPDAVPVAGTFVLPPLRTLAAGLNLSF